MLEKDIQRKIILMAEAHGWYVVKLIQTNKNGFPDLQLMKNREIIFIEVKRPGKKLEPLQEYRKKEIEKLGFKHYTISKPNIIDLIISEIELTKTQDESNKSKN